MRIYADCAATTKMRHSAIEAYREAAETVFGNASSLYSEGQRAADTLFSCRKRIANILNCRPDEIYFTAGGSEADNQAIASAVRAGAGKGKRKIIASAIEHHAVLHPLQRLRREGYEVVFLPVSTEGIVSVDDFVRETDDSVALVSVMTANNEIGTLQPVEESGRLCRQRGVLFHTDAVQAVGHIPVSTKDCDYLAASAHKFGGPKGTGILFARKGAPLFPLVEGGAQERNKRAGTEDVPAIAATAAALEEAVSGMEEKNRKILSMRERLIDGLLSSLPHSALNGSREKRLAGNANLCFEGCEGEALILYLDDLGIAVSSGSACTSGSLDPSHVLLAIGRVHEIAHGSLRFSLDEHNTEEEIDRLIKVVPEVVNKVRSMSPVWRDLNAGKRKFIL